MGIGDWLRFKSSNNSSNGRLNEIERRLDEMEGEVRRHDDELTKLKQLVSRGLTDTLDRARDLKNWTESELHKLQAQISAQMELLEKVVSGELDAPRREEVKRLLIRARKIKARVEKLIARNDNLPLTATGRQERG